jgi:hypothetical protein
LRKNYEKNSGEIGMERKITLKNYRKVMEKFDLDMKLWVNSDGIKMEKSRSL